MFHIYYMSIHVQSGYIITSTRLYYYMVHRLDYSQNLNYILVVLATASKGVYCNAAPLI